MNKLFRKKILGFSLLEAVIAAFVAAVGLLGFAQLQTVALFNSNDSRLRTEALNLAQEQIETLRNFATQSDYDNISSNGSTLNILITGMAASFDLTWTTVAVNTTIDAIETNVQVTWTDARGGDQLVQLTSYIASADPVKGGMSLVDFTAAAP